MNAFLQRFYNLSPIAVQEALLTAFSQRLNRQRYGGRFAEFQNLLDESQWWDPVRMRAWQEESLRRVLIQAYQHVPYYRETFRRHGYDPARFNGLDDLARLPLLERETIKLRGHELLSTSTQPRHMVVGHTSGTTGSPLALRYDADTIAINYAVLDRQYRWAGLKLERDGDRVAVLRGNMIVPLQQDRPPFWRHNRALNQLLFSSFHLSQRNVSQYVNALRAFRPAALDGYPSSLFILAKLLIRNNESVPVRAVITSSETLYDFQRDAIEAAFECKVFDYYAAAERVIFSVECGHREGHHLCEEYGITEFVDDSGQTVPAGEEGFMVGTALHNLGMPLIRYRMTDRSTRSPNRCSCGRQLPLMSDVTTKSEDILRLPDGRWIPPSVLTHPFKPLHSVEASQLIQTDEDRLLVRIVPGPTFCDRDRLHLVNELQARLGVGIRIDVELVDELPRTKSGKFKWVTNEVNSDF